VRVAIVGAGIAGLSCAAALEAQGWAVSLFDKGKRPGGRLSSLVLGDRQWDFGAPFLAARDRRFVAAVLGWQDQGVAAPWPEGPPGAVVGVPAMSALVAAQCAGRQVHFQAQVQRLERSDGLWWLRGAELAAGPFEAVVIAVPAEQAAALLSLHDLSLASEAAAVRSAPCWTAMVAFAEPLDGTPAFVRDVPVIAWAAPGRDGPARRCWVIQADAHWSRAHLESAPEAVAPLLLDALAAQLGPLPVPEFLKAHRWRYARPVTARALLAWNPELRLGACGDWCAGPGVEAAWLSGQRLGAAMGEAVRRAPAAESAAPARPPSGSAAAASQPA
jgi:predicted NAD/FAD-dependent oxidoreductase